MRATKPVQHTFKCHVNQPVALSLACDMKQRIDDAHNAHPRKEAFENTISSNTHHVDKKPEATAGEG